MVVQRLAVNRQGYGWIKERTVTRAGRQKNRYDSRTGQNEHARFGNQTGQDEHARYGSQTGQDEHVRFGRRTEQNEHNRYALPDYRTCRLSGQEIGKSVLLYGLITAAVSWLFFNRWIVWLVLWPGVFLYLQVRRSRLAEEQRQELRREFLTGMQLVCTLLRAGYAMENTFREALPQLIETYGSGAAIVQEFRLMAEKVGLNYPVEKLLMDLGERSGVEDIRSFAEVFAVARRMGGDLLLIIGNTVSSIERKEETLLEIRTVLSGKRMELNVMCAAPLAILGYIRLTSPAFLMPMYGQVLGILVMSVSLAMYAIAVWWGRRILDIEV